MEPPHNNSSDLHDRLHFLGLDADQRATFAEAQPIIAKAVGPALDIFYAKAKSHPETAKFFSNEAHIQHAKSRQVAHWTMISSGKLDEGYTRAVTAIGHTHARLGLEPRWYIGGYALILDALTKSMISDEIKGFGQSKKAKRLGERLGAVIKAAMLDMDYSISTYLDALAEERSRSEEERQRLESEQEAALTALDRALDGLSHGDLSRTLDEDLSPRFAGLKSKYNDAIATLSSAFSEVIDESQRSADNTRDLSVATDEMSKRTEQQAAALEETAAALEEITAVTKQTAARTREARSVVISSAEEANRSGEIVGQAIDAMSAIEDSSTRITQIIGVIDDISFQTNLLALNAGVEAARAGESGRGFAVVAQEVRELAQRSATAAKEIKGLIAKSSEDVEKGVTLVNRTGEALKTIAGQVQTINEHIAAIATASEEQSTGVSEISAAIHSMDQMTQKNAAMVEETNASTRSLHDASVHLAALVSRFSVSRSQSFQPVSSEYKPRYAA